MHKSATTVGSTSRITRQVSLILSIATATAIGFAAPRAWAAATDNIVPIGDFDVHERCRKGSAGGSANVCQTDNRVVGMYRQGSLSSAQKTRVDSVIDAQYSPTDLVMKWESSPSYHGSAETDFIYQIGTVVHGDDEVVGRAWCDDPIEVSVKCDQTYIRIENGYVTKKRICHESGHAAGLLHGSNAVPRLSNRDNRLGCMETPSDGGSESLKDNNRDNINSVY